MDLALNDLACRRSGRLIFQDLSATVPAGRAIELRGPNGVGKSSLLRLLAGMVPVAGGDARLGEVSLAASRGAFQERVTYSGHLDGVKPALTVAENLGHWGSILGAGADRVAAALDRFGLGAIGDRLAAQCSAGQKRRLGLARLLLADRPLWLLDEPTASLDTDSSALVARLVGEHIATGGIALVATHIDLGLPGTGVLRLEPLAEADKASADPFLEGAW